MEKSFPGGSTSTLPTASTPPLSAGSPPDPSPEEHVTVRIPFNFGWTVQPKVSSFTDLMAGRNAGTAVTLPHDAVISSPRSATDSEGPSTGFFSGGVVEYRKAFDVPAQWSERQVWVEFEGVYRDAMVFVNDAFAG